ncbi:MAG: hypothetical protein RID15_14875 [Marinovum algicola]|uniref:Uncharacterized protein n=1 Tax=Marinovum algicola TaxID=42444 RepID=A0A975W757_9RHOB|nr:MULTISPECIES: hypothetical protein [Marinovum]MDD9739119.1 hypothetical protein [Marinovum sp. SP66]SEI78472.1 hypothetical protein SAMN04487940_10240 [Marinovum algicola]SLN17766.1 hypothetical protein MAA5396_00474 [Marinovum algicola]
MGSGDKRRVGKRRVFYIPGYDPIHPRRYRELYRREAARQAAISGYDIALRPRAKSRNYGWHVTGEFDGAVVETEVEVLVWSDIVKHSMGHGIFISYLRMIYTAIAYIGSGAFWRLARLQKGPVIAALYPVVMLLLEAALAALVVWGAVKLGLLLSPWVGWLGPLVGGAAGLALAWALLEQFRRWDGKLFVYYLMHDYSYNARAFGAMPPELEARIAEFVESIAAACDDPVDEILVIGHSSGAHLGVSVLSDLIRAGHVRPDGPALGFLSLGHVVPMVSFLPRAWRLRADLAYLSERDEIFWVDVTAPGDGCAFALCDPVAVTGVAGPAKKWPLVFSAAFTKTLSPERWRALRWRFFRLHFQYLCAFDRPGDYDYFQITAGPDTLATRYRNRRSSRSVIDRPVNKFTSTAP